MTGRALGLALASIVLSPAGVAAHPDHPVMPHDLWSAWTVAPTVIAPIVFGAALYLRGVHALWRRAGRGRGLAPWRVGCFSGGMLAMSIALISPVDALGEALFAGHMVQHLVLMTVAAPLLALGAPIVGWLAALAPEHRHALLTRWRRARRARVLWQGASHPISTWLASAAVLWFWHAPGPYDAAVRNDVLHALEHASFLGAALLFWWPVVNPARRARLATGWSLLYLFTACMQSGVLGALLTFARAPLYTAHLDTAAAWGLSPLEDQQLAGVLMWWPAGIVYLAAVLTLLAFWLREAERLTAVPAPLYLRDGRHPSPHP